MELFGAQAEIWHLQSVTGFKKSGSLGVTAAQTHPAGCMAVREGTAALDVFLQKQHKQEQRVNGTRKCHV